jgi:O-antigen ligase
VVLQLRVRPIFRRSVFRTALVLASAAACALLIVKPLVSVGVVLAVAPLFLLYLFAATLDGRVEPVVLCWALIFPLGYYFLSFPREKSIITFDRALLLVLLAAMARASRQMSQQVPHDLRRSTTMWLIFLAIAGFSVIRGGATLTTSRLFVDSFCLPALLGWCVIRNYRVREHAGSLHIAASLMAIYVACIGAAEMMLKQDLLPLPGSTILFAGSLPRPNGPFYSNDSFAIIGLTTFLLLLFLRNTLNERVPVWRRIIHGAGVTGALMIALMPMFRSVVTTFILILMIETLTTRKPGRRALGVGLLLLCIVTVSLVSMLVPDAYEDRRSPDNVYSRIAQHKQTLQVFLSHSIAGVGLGQFMDVVNGEAQYLALYQHVRSADSPHNNLGGILAETGILGFVPYVAAQVTLVLAFCKLRKRRTRDSQLVWTSFLYVFLGYWINGMMLASGYSSDLNLWFVFTIAILYKYAITEPAAAPRRRAGIPLHQTVRHLS